MLIPRFIEAGQLYEVNLFCPACGYAITKDRVTEGWKYCPCPEITDKGLDRNYRCGEKLVTIRTNYPS